MATGRCDPSASFRFKIEFKGGPGVDARFTECSGLEFEVETFDYKEGGEQTKVHRLPGRVKYGNLTLKRGIAEDGQKLWRWVMKMIQGEIELCNVTVSLMDSQATAPVRTWTFVDAYPVKWTASALSAEQNAIAIETLTLAHQGLLPNG
ncbi:MAG: phage tail protein [Anaerolineae bacterium]